MKGHELREAAITVAVANGGNISGPAWFVLRLWREQCSNVHHEARGGMVFNEDNPGQ